MSQTLLFFLSGAWGGYGAYCFAEPFVLEKLAGMKLAKDAHWGFLVEVQAMYGGLQMAIGLVALSCALSTGKAKKRRTIETLRFFSFLMTGIAVSRLAAMLQHGRSIVPSLDPRDHIRVANEGLQTMLPEKYNANAAWFFELPGGLASYYFMKKEEEELKQD